MEPLRTPLRFRDLVETRDYESFNAEKLKCRACYVGKVYDCVVGSVGNKVDPSVVVIGEAPGREEVQQGIPFVGKAGKRLRIVLNACGFRQGNSLITNTIPCRPRDNQFPQVTPIVRDCVQRWLLHELAILRPPFILLLGNSPLKALFGVTGITKYRGHTGILDGSTCVFTFHPSFVERKLNMANGEVILGQFTEDVRKVAELAGFRMAGK